MEDNLQPPTPTVSPAPDRVPKERSRRESSRLNSDSNSSITVDRFKDLPSLHCLDVVQTIWTDEKHRIYLDSMEASFVKELHQLRQLRALDSQQKICKKQTMSNISSSLDATTSRMKVKLERKDPVLDSTADSPASSDLWMNNFSSAGNQSRLGAPDVLGESGNCSSGRHLRNMRNFYKFTRSSQQFSTCRCDSPAMTAEVSGQNFVDDYQRESFGDIPIAKRLKKATATTNYPSIDQALPFERLSSNKDKQSPKSSPQHPENRVHANLDLCYHLRGS